MPVIKKAKNFEDLFKDGEFTEQVKTFRTGYESNSSSILHAIEISELVKLDMDPKNHLIAAFSEDTTRKKKIIFEQDLENVLFYRTNTTLYFFDKAKIRAAIKSINQGEDLTINNIYDDEQELIVVTYTEGHRTSPL